MNPDQTAPYCLKYTSRYETGDMAGKGFIGLLIRSYAFITV